MNEVLQIAGYVFGVGLVIVGALGAVYPLLPGAPVAFLGFWLLAWLGHYERVGGYVIGLLAVLAVLATVLDSVLSALGARRARASNLAILGSAVGSLLGLPFGFFGVILGPFIFALLGEYITGKNLARAQEVAFSTWIGTLLGMIAKVAVTWAMIGIFLVAWFF
jgi:uncharacterized protein